MHQIKNYMSSTSQIGESGVDRNYHHTMTWDLVSHPCTLKGLASGFSLGAAPLPWNGFILACNVWACRKITSPNQSVYPIITQRNVLRRSRIILESFLQEINRTYTCNKFIHLHAGEKVYDGVCITSRAISPQLHKLESPEEGHWEHVPAEKQRHRNYHNTMTWDLASHPCTLIGLASGFSLGAAPASWNGFVWGCKKVCRQKENHTSQSTCHST